MKPILPYWSTARTWHAYSEARCIETVRIVRTILINPYGRYILYAPENSFYVRPSCLHESLFSKIYTPSAEPVCEILPQENSISLTASPKPQRSFSARVKRWLGLEPTKLPLP